MSSISSIRLKQALDDLHGDRALVDLVLPAHQGVLFARVITLLMTETQNALPLADLKYQLLDQRLSDLHDGLDSVLLIGSAQQASSLLLEARILDFILPYGLSGILLDGELRDELESTEPPPVWSLLQNPSASSPALLPGRVNQTLNFCGDRVQTGDYVFSDQNGTLFIPAEDVDLVIDQVLNRA